MARGEAKMPIGFRVETGDTESLPVIGAPTMKQVKVDDRDRNKPSESSKRLFEQAADIMATQPMPPSSEAEMTDDEVRAKLADSQRIINRELAAAVARLTNIERVSPEGRHLLQVALRRLINATMTTALAGDVLALAGSGSLTAAAKLIAIRGVIDFHSRPAACESWCNDCYPNPDGDMFKLHRGVVGQVRSVNPDDGETTVFEVAIERADNSAVNLGQAYVRLPQVEGGERVVGGPRAVAKLIRLLVKAHRILRADRKRVRAMRKAGPLDRAVLGMTDEDLAAFADASESGA